MERSLRGPALHEAVRDYIKQYILDHKLSAGDSLSPEGQLAQELGVGRSSVREAVKALQSLGIVETRPGNGLYVREYNFDPILETFSYGMRFDPTALAEFTQIRLWLESAVIGEAVKQINEENISQLEDLIKIWADRVHTGKPYSDLDKQFHCILYGTLNNKSLIKLIEVFWIAFENLNIEAIQASDPVVELKDHQAILEAVKSRDAALARQRLLLNFNHLQNRIHRVIDST